MLTLIDLVTFYLFGINDTMSLVINFKASMSGYLLLTV